MFFKIPIVIKDIGGSLVLGPAHQDFSEFMNEYGSLSAHLVFGQIPGKSAQGHPRPNDAVFLGGVDVGRRLYATGHLVVGMRVAPPLLGALTSLLLAERLRAGALTRAYTSIHPKPLAAEATGLFARAYNHP